MVTEGPKQERFSYILHTDNSTVSNIDLGKLGGNRETVAVFQGNSLVSYLRKPGTNNVDVVGTRTIAPSKIKWLLVRCLITPLYWFEFFLDNPDVMLFKIKDIETGYEMVATMLRQK